MDKKITDIKAEQILDSRGNPTLKVSVYVGDIFKSFEVPSGASTGKYEACELRDGENGKSGVLTAIKQIEEIIKPALLGINITDQKIIDETMLNLDGTQQKTKLGGNSMIGVSIACAKTAGAILGKEVYEYLKNLRDINPSKKEPYLYFNLINGGKHAKTKLAFQEYHIVPQVDKVTESVEISKAIQNKLDEILISKYGGPLVKGDEGGVALEEEDVFVPLRLIKQAVDELGYENKIKYALDVASSSFYDEGEEVYKFMSKSFSKEEMKDLYVKMCEEFPIISIEDPFEEEDFESFTTLQAIIPEVKLIGDDLTVTNINRLDRAIREKSIKGIIIKPNQIGTLTETLNTIELARKNDIDCIISHRSGETMDDFIGDLSYAFGCFGLKSGALGPKERDIKYNRLINIAK
ncbi:TPA: phosphopyruvate hydratase [Candidatus Nomurabacteria bacterium]|nr:MAG: hypothetical protein O210_OD1C00001G0172 [Parcubacteria bacterium RAAC4_OD1_1]HCY26631.1 phosphopyruvate hydratase [Candidatus Nomurabacteria bacterium]